MALITADQVNDTITGTAGNDSIVGSANGADLIDGAGGHDTITSGTGLGGDNLRVIDTLRGGDGNDLVTGRLSALMFGDAGDDTLATTSDFSTYTLEGGTGDDRLEGALDNNGTFAAYTAASAGVRVNASLTTPQDVGGGQGVDTLIRMDGVIGSSHNDTLAAGETVSFGGGGKALLGGAGDDRLEGGPGADGLDPGSGNDVVLGGAGSDTISFGLGAGPQPTGGLTLDLGRITAQDVGGGMGVKTITDVENVFASAFADTVIGTATDNNINGEGGADSLTGLSGDDALDGGEGDDTLMGGAGDDTFFTRGGKDWVRGEDGDDRLFGGISSDVLQDQNLHGNKGADTFGSGRGADTVRGGQGDDVITGGDGDDWMAGDRGGDVLTGGPGADVFHAWKEAGLDRVTDFNVAEGDRVYLLPGAAPTVRQVDADLWIDFGGGNVMVLQGVRLSSLPDGWIFGA